jgi:hypothetical protein
MTNAQADLRNEAHLEEIIERLRKAITRSVRVGSRMHGLRAQQLFRAVLIALGDFAVLVDEDAGEPYYDDRVGALKVPDLRVVRRDGAQLLIEAKNVPPTHTSEPYRLSAAELEGLRRYGDLMDVPVALAHYWSAWNRWTLVGLDQLVRRGSVYQLSLGSCCASATGLGITPL